MNISPRLKLIISVFALSIIASSFACSQTTDHFNYLKTNFYNPPSIYRTAPFMVWNGKVTAEEIDRMIKEFKDAGCGEFIIHPRPGLITEYLSDEWFILYHYAVLKAKAAGMKVWIYDENSYPSGFAGGHVPAEMPESYNQGVGLALTKVKRLPANAKDYFLCIKKEGDRSVDITNDLDIYKNSEGDFYLYTKTYYPQTPWFGGFSNVDLLVNGVTQKFISTTMKGYQARMKGEFGKTILGVFSDEPSIISPRNNIRWTPDLFSAFKHFWGYDLKPLLPLLSEESGNWLQVRHNYQQTLLEMFIERWGKPSNKYYEANHLKWTGHYYEHYWPQMNFGPDNMAMYVWHQQPGVDMLFNQFNESNPQAQFGNIRAIKELRSVANQMGRERTLSETYGGGGWDETFKDFKRLGDWEYVLGVNFMNQHLAHMTITGTRKYDYPPEFNYHSTWWQDYRILNDYFGRLSMMMSKGVQKNNILILEPTTTLWSYASNLGDSPRLMEIGKSFQSFVTTLEKSQTEYDLGSENIMRDHGTVVKNKLIIGKASYSVVVLPPDMENINKPTYDLLRRFVRQGGKLICFSTPTRISGSFNKDVDKIFTGPSVVHLSQLTDDVIRKYFHPEGLDIRFNAGDLYHHRRMMNDGELIFLVNSSMDEATTGNLSLRGKTLLKMDAQTGKIYRYPATTKNNRLSASFHIEPAGSLLLYALSAKSSASYPTEPAEAGNNRITPETPTLVKRLKDNILNIDFCDLKVKDSTYTDIHTYHASKIAFKAHGFPNGNPWSTSVQYKRDIINKDTFITGGFTVTYHLKINGTFEHSGMKLVSEQPELFTVRINGTKAKAIPGEWVLDRSFGVYNIEKLVREGDNTIELSVTPMSVYAEIEPVYVMGNFSVNPEEKGWSISAPVSSFTLGSWKDQKRPFYPWEMSYSKKYDLSSLNGPYAVKLNKWLGTVAEVFVNGKKAGIIAFNPYKLDVTSLLHKGENTIDVHIIGSQRNLFGPFYHKSDGIVEPHYFRNFGKPLAGKDYPMVDYGMMEDFELMN
jgi:hypothetical protein